MNKEISNPIKMIGNFTARITRRNGLTRSDFRRRTKMTPHWHGFTDQQKRHANTELHATSADLARTARKVERLLERARWER